MSADIKYIFQENGYESDIQSLPLSRVGLESDLQGVVVCIFLCCTIFPPSQITASVMAFSWLAAQRPQDAWSYRKRCEPAVFYQSSGGLKKSGKLQVLEWVDTITLAKHKEVAPYNENWFLHMSCFHSMAPVPLGRGWGWLMTKI